MERLARAEIHGDLVTVHNVRNFEYRAVDEFTPRWETREFDLRRIEGLDLFVCYWGPRHIAHTIMSFVFANGRHLPISIETRKMVGQEYSAMGALLRQYELYYVVGDERDVIRQRTSVRGERVYLYRIDATADASRALLLEFLTDVNRLAAKPRWYNAITRNCTTLIRYHAENIAAGDPWDWRMLLNGHIDEIAYKRGRLDTTLPFEELRARSDITERARAAEAADDFSARIREGLPDPRHQ